MNAMWAAVAPGIQVADILSIIGADAQLGAAYQDVASHLAQMDFVYAQGRQPEAEMEPDNAGRYRILYGLQREQSASSGYHTNDRYVGAVLHEMMHIAAALQYATNVPAGAGPSGGGTVGHVANLNLPAPQQGEARDQYGLTQTQWQAVDPQIATMDANWTDLRSEAQLDETAGTISPRTRALIDARTDYAIQPPGILAHYDTVLFDLLYSLQSSGDAQSRSYAYAHEMLTDANSRRAHATGQVARVTRQPLPAPPPTNVPAPVAPRQSLFSAILQWFTG